MKNLAQRLFLAAALGLTAIASNSCGTTGDNGGYYDSGSAGFDSWYYGGYYDDVDLIVSPPGDRPNRPVRPSHPIARPPMGGGGFGGGGFGGGGFGGGGIRGGGGRR